VKKTKELTDAQLAKIVGGIDPSIPIPPPAPTSAPTSTSTTTTTVQHHHLAGVKYE
jgi:bacteriocin-like protein